MEENTTLYVANLNREVSKEGLMNFFGRFGETDGVLIHQNKNRKLYNYGVIKFQKKDDTMEAMKRMQGRWIHNRRIRVQLARRQLKINRVGYQVGTTDGINGVSVSSSCMT